MPRYAENTSVSSEKSRGEIERTLIRYGASKFSYGWSGDRAIIAFAAHERMIRFELPLPSKNSEEFTHTPGKRHLRRSAAQAEAAWEQASRQRWRALALAIKAKLEAVECEITSFEQEFLAHIVMPNGRTVGELVTGQIEQGYAKGTTPRMTLMLLEDGK